MPLKGVIKLKFEQAASLQEPDELTREVLLRVSVSNEKSNRKVTPLNSAVCGNNQSVLE